MSVTASTHDIALKSLYETRIRQMVRAGEIKEGDLELKQNPDGTLEIIDHRPVPMNRAQRRELEKRARKKAR